MWLPLTMGRGTTRLVEVAGPPLGSSDLPPQDAPEPLRGLLSRVNGFYAFESSLHVFPTGPNTGAAVTLEAWNAEDNWRREYEDLADGQLFFAEDAFGGQFCLTPEGVHYFEPETGEVSFVADSVEAWAARIMNDYERLTGAPLAHAWQQRYGALPAGKRLVPRQPFVLNGEYTVDNLQAMDAAEGMRLRGQLATQIANLPDGAQVVFEVGQ